MSIGIVNNVVFLWHGKPWGIWFPEPSFAWQANRAVYNPYNLDSDREALWPTGFLSIMRFCNTQFLHPRLCHRTCCLKRLQTSVWELPGSNPGRHTLQPTSRTWRNITLNYVSNINVTWLVSGGIRHCGASFRILWLFRSSHSFIFFCFHFYHCIYGCASVYFCKLRLFVCLCIIVVMYVPF